MNTLKCELNFDRLACCSGTWSFLLLTGNFTGPRASLRCQFCTISNGGKSNLGYPWWSSDDEKNPVGSSFSRPNGREENGNLFLTLSTRLAVSFSRRSDWKAPNARRRPAFAVPVPKAPTSRCHFDSRCWKKFLFLEPETRDGYKGFPSSKSRYLLPLAGDADDSVGARFVQNHSSGKKRLAMKKLWVGFGVPNGLYCPAPAAESGHGHTTTMELTSQYHSE